MSKKNSIVLLLFSITFVSRGQFILSNTDYSLINNNFTIINPSYSGIEAKKEFHIQQSGFTGIKKVIRSFYTHGYVNLDTTNQHHLGFQVQNHNEGKYIQSNQLRLLYSYHLVKNQSYTLSAGTTIGTINLLIKGNNRGSRSGSAWGISGDFGLWLKTRSNWEFGLSGNNLLSNELTPINETYQASHFYSLVVQKVFEVNYYLNFVPSFIIYKNNPLIDWELFLKAELFNKYLVNLTFNSLKSIFWNVGIYNLKLKKSLLRLGFGSNLPSASPLNSDRFEWVLSYYFK